MGGKSNEGWKGDSGGGGWPPVSLVNDRSFYRKKCCVVLNTKSDCKSPKI